MGLKRFCKVVPMNLIPTPNKLNRTLRLISYNHPLMIHVSSPVSLKGHILHLIRHQHHQKKRQQLGPSWLLVRRKIPLLLLLLLLLLLQHYYHSDEEVCWKKKRYSPSSLIQVLEMVMRIQWMTKGIFVAAKRGYCYYLYYY